MTLTALIIALLVQDDAAEFLRKVEERAAAAKTLRWKGTAIIGADRRQFVVALDVAFKEGNRARFDGKSTTESVPLAFTFTCDGKRVSVKSSKKDAEACDADKGFASALNRILIRGGLLAINHLKPDAVGEKLLEAVKVSGVSMADEKVGDRAAKVLKYTVEVDGKAASVKLWVDAKTLAPIKRELEANDESKEPTISETFDEWVADGEIKDEVFTEK